MHRRDFLKQSLAASGGLFLAGSLPAAQSGPRTSPDAPAWRTFEVLTRVEVLEPSGVSHAWLPLPLLSDTDYYRRLGDTWSGNAAVARSVRDPRYDAGMLYAEWAASEKSPVLEVRSRFAARNRRIDFGKPNDDLREEKKLLAMNLEPTALIPTDGIVAETARTITQGKPRDIDKARAIYEWIVEHTFRDPKVRGCGLGDIRTMLETGYLGGKCADLNALYVGLARAAGLPARDVYGVRVAASQEFKSLGKTGDVTQAQHCRAEVYLTGYGWVPVDPADVRKVALEEQPGGLKLDDPRVQQARARLFGYWEMNWLPYNYAHDLRLPESSGASLPFLMYPQAETGGRRKDSLSPESFRYSITSREIET